MDTISPVKRPEEQELDDELLEGIPNEITLAGIAAKLPYRAWQIAQSISPHWHRAFQSGMVYDTRVRSQATETFVLVLCDYADRVDFGSWVTKRTLSLFSPNEDRWYKLPPMPGCALDLSISISAKFVGLGSCIYVLGKGREEHLVSGRRVLVLDLAKPPLKWRRCAKMQVERYNFSVGVLHGKIFVFGGTYAQSRLPGCSNEVYDPELDAWSWIAPITPPGSGTASYAVVQTWSTGQKFLCEAGRVEHPAALYPAEPSSPKHIYGYDKLLKGCRKLVIRDGVHSPTLLLMDPARRDKSFDPDAEDQMEGLHKMFEDQRIDKVRRLPFTPDNYIENPWTPPRKRRGPLITYPEHSVWIYDPLKDGWRKYELDGRVDTSALDSWDLRKDERQLVLPSDPSCHVFTQVWTMNV